MRDIDKVAEVLDLARTARREAAYGLLAWANAAMAALTMLLMARNAGDSATLPLFLLVTTVLGIACSAARMSEHDRLVKNLGG